MEMMIPKLNEIFPDWLTGGGIFTALQTFDVPWKDDTISDSLDLDYHGNNSGDKFISPLVAKVVSGETATAEEIYTLARTIYNLYSVNWSKLWATMSAEYNPIENYNMVETMTDDETVTEYGRTHTRTDNITHTKTGTETETPDLTDTRTDALQHTKTGTETETPDLTDTRTDALQHTKTGTETESPNITETTTPNLHNTKTVGVYGFNSATAVESDTAATSATGQNTVSRTGSDQTTYNTTEGNTGTQTVKKTGENEVEYNLSEQDTGTQTLKKTGENEIEYDLSERDTGTVTDADTGSDTHTRNYELTRSGNIGVTTSQQMLTQERELWKWNFFHDTVFPDVDRILALCIY